MYYITKDGLIVSTENINKWGSPSEKKEPTGRTNKTPKKKKRK